MYLPDCTWPSEEQFVCKFVACTGVHKLKPYTNEGCPECIQLFWISWEPVAWPWSNLATSEQSFSRGSSQSAVSRRWLSLCTVWASHSQWPSEQISFITTMRLPILELSCSLFWQSFNSPKSVSPLLAFYKAKIAFKREEIYECDSHTAHNLSQRRLTADWLAPRENDCS